ncbi:MAG: hypothetical protein M0Z58_03855 [Nitrospiraceae bacterium]|nr:hypothetical protein [Nitrospiraceae bacterium]
MTKKELAESNIGITFDFVRRVIESPALADSFANGAELDFIDKEMHLKHMAAKRGRRIYRYKVEHTFEPIKG